MSEFDESLIDEALAQIGREARGDETCSICHALVRPDRRARHLDWHASLMRDVEHERLPMVFGTAPTTAGEGERGEG
jgi:hypothetical protein